MLERQDKNSVQTKKMSSLLKQDNQRKNKIIHQIQITVIFKF